MNFHEFDSYGEAARYLVVPSTHKDDVDLDPEPLYSADHPPVRGSRRVTDRPRPPEAEEAGKVRAKRARLSDGDIYDIVTEHGITTATALRAHAHTDQRLVEYCMRNSRRLPALIGEARALASARHTQVLLAKDRMAFLHDAHAAGCDASCGGRWYSAARSLLAYQGLDGRFQRAAYHAFEVGRAKGSNLYIHGGKDCGKSFMVAPIIKIYGDGVLVNPVPGSHPLLKMPGKKVVLLDDFRYHGGYEILPWGTLLNWLEGHKFDLKVPKNGEYGCTEDIAYTDTAPVIITSSGRVTRLSSAGMFDQIETAMFDVRVQHLG